MCFYLESFTLYSICKLCLIGAMNSVPDEFIQYAVVEANDLLQIMVIVLLMSGIFIFIILYGLIKTAIKVGQRCGHRLLLLFRCGSC